MTYDEIINILDLKSIPTKGIGYSLKPDIYQLSDINKTTRTMLPLKVEIIVTINEKN